MISVRRTKSLLTASFRFHLTMDTLAVLLYTSSLPRRVRDFHPLERAHGAQTKETDALLGVCYHDRCDHDLICGNIGFSLHNILHLCSFCISHFSHIQYDITVIIGNADHDI